MKAVVINLDRSVDRREFMRRQLDALRVDHEFFRGTDASRGDLAGVSRYDEPEALRRLGHALQPSEVGCFASHYRAWELCVERGLPLVIMEDDVSLESGFLPALHLCEQQIAGRQFIRLCGLASRKTKVVQKLPGGFSLVRYRKGPRGTQCYAISPEGARALMDHARVWIDAVDLYLDSFWLHGLVSYAITPFHVLHEVEGAPRSLIGDSRWSASRPLGRKLRRETTHWIYRIRRGWFNVLQDYREWTQASL